MRTIISKDGTNIAFDQIGSGPTVILVAGAIQHRAFDQETAYLADLLAPYFNVINYDRRGRGESGDTQPYAPAREIEDIDALIQDSGGEAYLYGMSSGAALAMEAAVALGNKVKKLAMYEAPFNDDPEARQRWQAYRQELNALLAAGRRGDAMALFMGLVGMPPEQLQQVQQSPAWPIFERVAPTLAYDAAILGEESAVPCEQAARVQIPALVMAGEASPPFMRTTAAALAHAMPGGRGKVLPGQTHAIKAEALAPELIDFYCA
ncbi:MAG: alpha/beta hydrolase [Caldilineaceae bacterium]